MLAGQFPQSNENRTSHDLLRAESAVQVLIGDDKLLGIRQADPNDILPPALSWLME
jgi:hypothetical protein